MATIRTAAMAGVIAVGIAGKKHHLRMTKKGGPAWAAFLYVHIISGSAAA
jgi:hypothetical protein